MDNYAACPNPPPQSQAQPNKTKRNCLDLLGFIRPNRDFSKGYGESKRKNYLPARPRFMALGALQSPTGARYHTFRFVQRKFALHLFFKICTGAFEAAGARP
jgi:hypothetical protein